MNRIESIILGTPQTNITFLQLPSQHFYFFQALRTLQPCTTDKHVAVMYADMERLYAIRIDIVQCTPTTTNSARLSRRRRSHRDSLYPRKTFLSAAIFANRWNIKGKYTVRCTMYMCRSTNFWFGLNREDLLYAFILWCQRV